jgi:hypothetical protein
MNTFFSRFGLSWVMLRQVVGLLACWWIIGSTRSATMWKMVPYCHLWCIWTEINDRTFEDCKWNDLGKALATSSLSPPKRTSQLLLF